MKYPGFVGPSNEVQAVTADAERTVNLYPERSQSQGATTEWALLPTPGVDEIGEASASPGRGHFFIGSHEYAVIGNQAVEIDINGVETVLGTVAVDSNPATLSSNGDGGGQILFTSGRNGYIWDINSTTFSQIAFLDDKATKGGMLDGFFIVLDANTSTFYVSDLLEGTTWDPTQFAQRSDAPDPWISMQVLGNYLWLLGTQTSGVWYNTGASPFPFALHPSGRIPYGIAAPFSTSVLGSDLIWLGANRDGNAMVLKASGFRPEVVSTYAVQQKISSYANITDAVGDSYSDRGHNFYMLTFPSENVTWVWDSETSQWHERGTWLAEESRYQAWRPRWHVFAFDEHRMLDGSTGKIYRMGNDLPLDVDGRSMRRLRRAPALMDEMNRVFYSLFELDFQPGLGVVSGQGEDPQIMLRWSNDGGQTWSSEVWRSAGKIGEYMRRAQWWRLGQARRRVFEVAWAEPVPFRVTNAYLTLGQEIERAS